MGTVSECPSVFDGINAISPVLLWELSKKRTAKIIVTPLTKKIAWQYLGEPRQEIEADDYTLVQKNVGDPIYLKYYFIFAQGQVNGRFPPQTTVPAIFNDGASITIRTIGSHREIVTNFLLINSATNWRISHTYQLPGNTNCPQQTIESLLYWFNPNGGAQAARTGSSTSSSPGVKNISNIYLVEDTATAPFLCRQSSPECTFTVFKCGQIVHQEKRSVCPQVETYTCDYDFPKEKIIEVELNPFDVLFISKGSGGIIGFFWDVFLNLFKLALENLPFTSPILEALDQVHRLNPPECSLITVLRNLSSIEIIDQTCSLCNCSPPRILPECNPKDCDYGTCKVDCDTHYCCYDSNGVAVKIINK